MTAARCVMVQGTASSVGKSVLVTALCRIFRQDGFRVAPFKAQNMALNSFVTPEGGEIGRAQAVQAEAAGVPPSVAMNPILLKPEADDRSQVVVRGRPVDVLAARHYYQRKEKLWAVVVDSLAELRAQYEVVVIEGAGSPAEVNLKANDIVNMRVARHANAPVLLVGDIDRGGIFAALVGTLDLLDPEERALVQGLIINRFRGDVALLGDGLDFLERRTGKPVLGVIPYLYDMGLADEDSVVLEAGRGEPLSRRPSSAQFDRPGRQTIDIAVIQLPHLSNFDDFDPLAQEEGVRLRYVAKESELGRPDLVILPGTKTTIPDLEWLRRVGLAEHVVALAAAGTPVVGICGGFQMLGVSLDDTLGVEGVAGRTTGLGLLPVATAFAGDKTTHQVRAVVANATGLLAGLAGDVVAGYEIHMGQTFAVTAGDGARAQPALRLIERSGRPIDGVDGALSATGTVLGTYIHGLFDNEALRRGILAHLAARQGRDLVFHRPVPSREDQHDRLAAHVRAHLNLTDLYRRLGLQCPAETLAAPSTNAGARL